MRLGRTKRERGGECEASHQASFFTWLFYAHRDIYAVTYAIPNGGRRNKSEAAGLKCCGVKSGVPDIFVAWPTPQHHGLYIEFKFGKNKLTENQVNFSDLIMSKGYAFAVCYNVSDADKVLTEYLKEQA